MMKSPSLRTQTYEMGKGFMLDVTECRDTYEAWVWRDGFGVKDLMFSVLKSKTDMNEFLLMAERAYPEYADRFDKAYA